MEENNKLQKFDLDALPAFFKDLTPEQQKVYLEKLAIDYADLKKYVSTKLADSKTAEGDMVTMLEFLKQLETDNKIINVKQEFQTGSGKMEVNLKGGDKRFIIPIIIVFGIILIAIFIILFGRH